MVSAESITNEYTERSTMSGIGGIDTDENAGLLYEIFEYLVQAIVYTPVYFVGVAIIALPFTIAMLVSPQSRIAGYTLLTYISWAVVFGQLMALNEYESEDELRGLAAFVAGVATYLYYNLAAILTISFALAAEIAIGPEAAVAVALLLPAIDVQSSRLYQIGLAYFMLQGAFRLGTWIERAYGQIPIRKILTELLAILSSVENAVPPVVHYLSLDEFTRNRPLH